MRIVVSSQGETLDALASPVFGRCPTFVFVDSETMSTEAVPNPAMSQGGGAGIQATQFVVNQGAEAVLTGNLGPNAFDVLQAAGVPGYLVGGGTVGQAVAAFNAGQLQAMTAANVAAHAGMGGGRGKGTRSGGRRGMGMGPGAPPAVSTQSNAAKEAELAELRETLKGLRQQLAETMGRIENLEKEG
jgi:predicted Fe-Mo cluster-binding NifX family protein